MKRVLAADREDGLIGIWWYTDSSEVIGLSEPVDNGKLDGDYIQFSRGNHMNCWRKVIETFLPQHSDSVIDKGFKSMYRGRVIYDTKTACFVVICSQDLQKDLEFRAKITDYFQLSECNRRFEALDHYRYKNDLTGNPAIGALYFDN